MPEAADGVTVAVNVTLAPEAIVVLDAVKVVVVAVVEFVVPDEEPLQPPAHSVDKTSKIATVPP